MKLFLTSLLCLLFSFNSFGISLKVIGKKAREFLESKKGSAGNPLDGILSQSSKETYDEFSEALGILGWEPPENATKREVFEKFREAFEHARKNNMDLEDHYAELIFGKWWEDADFRAVMFGSIDNVHVYILYLHDNVDFLLKWWKQANDMGISQAKLLEYTDSLLDVDDIPTESVQTVLRATHENEDFAKDWMFVIRNNGWDNHSLNFRQRQRSNPLLNPPPSPAEEPPFRFPSSNFLYPSPSPAEGFDPVEVEKLRTELRGPHSTPNDSGDNVMPFPRRGGGRPSGPMG